jgi:hypothetical protein
VDLVCDFFISLGIDLNRGTYQVDAVPPQAVSPEAEPDTIAELLSTHEEFTTNGYPTGTRASSTPRPTMTPSPTTHSWPSPPPRQPASAPP